MTDEGYWKLGSWVVNLEGYIRQEVAGLLQ